MENDQKKIIFLPNIETNNRYTPTPTFLEDQNRIFQQLDTTVRLICLQF